jgi:hypothetical protein
VAGRVEVRRERQADQARLPRRGGRDGAGEHRVLGHRIPDPYAALTLNHDHAAVIRHVESHRLPEIVFEQDLLEARRLGQRGPGLRVRRCGRRHETQRHCATRSEPLKTPHNLFLSSNDL